MFFSARLNEPHLLLLTQLSAIVISLSVPHLKHNDAHFKKLF